MTQPPSSSHQPILRRPWFVLIAGLVAIGLFGALVGNTTDDDQPSTARPSSPSTVGSLPLPSTSTMPPAATATAPATVATTMATTTAGVDFVMPDVVGMDLQSAQDLVQTFGVFYSVSHDLLGSRNQLVDSNWVVCDQSVAPGQRVTGDVEGQLDFGVVKSAEQCP
jgi:hypothetical protein